MRRGALPQPAVSMRTTNAAARLPSGSAPDPDAILAAKSAKLRYVSDRAPGIERVRQRGHFSYRDSAGKEITDPDVLARIKALVIPPAWTNVWICASADGHLQATGRDARGRKQYRYHTRWRAVRDYLRKISGREITAKDFRTWAGTNLAIVAFCALKEEKPTKKSELEVVKSVAQQLGNTVAVCRKCYIHPAVISSYHGGSLRKSVANVSHRIPGSWLAVDSVRRLLAYSRDSSPTTRNRSYRHGPSLARSSSRRAESR